MLKVWAIIAGPLFESDVLVSFLIRCDLLRPEVARLIIVGASNSALPAETPSPSQTGNIGVCGAKLAWLSMCPLLDEACEVGGSGMDAGSSLAGDCFPAKLRLV